MSPKEWAKIIAGMLAVFAVGMFVVSGIKAGKRRVTELTTTASTITLPMLGVPFRLNDLKLGGMQKLQVERSAPDRIEAFRLTVKLADGVDVGQFADCELTVRDANQIDEKTTFACLTEADSGFANLVQFGTITFLPSGQEHRLMLPEQVRNDLRNAEAHRVRSVTSSQADSSGHLSVKVNGEQVVDIQGSDSGGRILIRDPKTGKVIVDIQGSEQGGAVKVNGKPVAKGTASGN